MQVQINIVEVASDLAALDLENHYRDECSIDGELYVEDKNGDTRWNNKAQDVFNMLYDSYYDLLLSFRLNSSK